MAADIAVVGGGIVGLSTAYALLAERPATRLVLLEKEARVAVHQTGHNSGVVHSGVYYAPGSLKARLCRRGRTLLLEYARQRGIPYEVPGKVIVATSPSEIPRLHELARRARANGITEARLLDPAGLADVEPAAVGRAALHVPETAIIDYGAVGRALAKDVSDRGGEIRLGARVRSIRPHGDLLEIDSDAGSIECRFLVNAAGLYADHVARHAGLVPPAQIVPFRGEYFDLAPSYRKRIRGLIYPVPDPALPFLGVHFTPTMAGTIEAGPNAILAFAREGYT